MSSISFPKREVIQLRTETRHKVMPAVSLNNVYAGLTFPQHPHLADNNWSNGHQDSQCSESVGLTGPTSDTLRMIKQHNPYGFVPIMVCNSNNLMAGISVEDVYKFVVFDTECCILAVGDLGPLVGELGTAYFFLDNADKAICIKPSANSLVCFPTRNVSREVAGTSVQTLDPLWTSANIVTLVTGSPDADNGLYCTLPVWSAVGNLYWVCLSGKYNFANGTLTSPAYVAVVSINDAGDTELKASMTLDGQWIANSIASDEGGIFLVTNGVKSGGGSSNVGYMHYFGYDLTNQTIMEKWSETPTYESCGLLKPGQLNIGSGTTPSLFETEDGTPIVAITDNAYPKMNVLAYKISTGREIAKVPVLPNMRGANDASLIVAKGRIIYENNFGHVYTEPYSQLVSNEPGLGLVRVIPDGATHKGMVKWENNHISVFGMSMLARESGIVFAHVGNWNVPDAESKGAVYYLSAFDAWDGREIWRIPVGQGREHCKDYGGVYFDRSGTKMFMGTQRYLVSVQNYTPMVPPESRSAPTKLAAKGPKKKRM